MSLFNYLSTDVSVCKPRCPVVIIEPPDPITDIDTQLMIEMKQVATQL